MQGLYFNTFDPNMSEKLHVLMAHFFYVNLIVMFFIYI